jgi:hypothetical protein
VLLSRLILASITSPFISSGPKEIGSGKGFLGIGGVLSKKHGSIL